MKSQTIQTKANPAPTLTISARRVALFRAAEKCYRKTTKMIDQKQPNYAKRTQFLKRPK